MLESLAQAKKLPLQSRSAATVESVLHATATILTTSGAEKLTKRHVASVAGVSVGAIYQYFPNRDALVAELIRATIQREEEDLRRFCKEFDGSPSEAFKVLVAIGVDHRRDRLTLAHPLRDPSLPTDIRSASLFHTGSLDLLRLFEQTWARLQPEPLTALDSQRLFVSVMAVASCMTSTLYLKPDHYRDRNFEASLLSVMLSTLQLPQI